MRIKTADLTGAALDWAVFKADGRDMTQYKDMLHEFGHKPGCLPGMYNVSASWAQGGPIIDTERPTFTPFPDGWVKCTLPDGTGPYGGETYLIAFARCFVASKLGDEVDVPEELS